MASDPKYSQLVKIAKLHYEENLSMQVIADQLQLSVSTISRALKQAREVGIVEIRVIDNSVEPHDHSIETQLERHFGLAKAIVVPTTGTYEERLNSLGRAMARYIETILHDGMIIGVSDGMTVAAVAANLRPGNPMTNIQTVPLIGGVGVPNAYTHPIEIARSVARNVSGVVRQLNAPAMVSNSTVRDAFMSDPVVQSAFEVINHCDIALVGVGAVIHEAAMVKNNVMSTQEMDQARELAAVGALCARFYDADGQAIESELDDRTISITLEQLQQIPYAIAVAIGEEKSHAIHAALVGRRIRIIGTDVQTASSILEIENTQETKE